MERITPSPPRRVEYGPTEQPRNTFGDHIKDVRALLPEIGYTLAKANAEIPANETAGGTTSLAEERAANATSSLVETAATDGTGSHALARRFCIGYQPDRENLWVESFFANIWLSLAPAIPCPYSIIDIRHSKSVKS